MSPACAMSANSRRCCGLVAAGWTALRRFWLLSCVIVWMIAAGCGASAAQDYVRGVALVIGNGDYDHLDPLYNPRNDANAIADLLQDIGFDTTVLTDRNAKQMRRDLEGFFEDAEDADFALIYYAGHGIEAGGENFLVPTDAKADEVAQDISGLLAINDYVERLRDTVKYSAVFLDACRTNPFPKDMSLTLAGGTSPVQVADAGLTLGRSRAPVYEATHPETDTPNVFNVIGFAAQPGRVALDGERDTNSPYASAILRHFGASHARDFSSVMTMITREVYMATNARQRPWVNQSIVSEISFGTDADQVRSEDARFISERRGLLLYSETLDDAQRGSVERLATDSELQLALVFGILRAADIDPEAEPEVIEAKLRAQIEHINEARATRPSYENSDPIIQELTRDAEAAEQQGVLNVAEFYRDKARALALERITLRNQTTERLRRQTLADLDIIVQAARTKGLGFNYSGAAEVYQQAFDLALDWDKDRAFDFRAAQLEALFRDYQNRADALSLDTLETLAWQEINDPSAGWTPARRATFFRFLGHVHAARFAELPMRRHFINARTNYETALALRADEAGLEIAELLGHLGQLTFDVSRQYFNPWEKRANLRKARDLMDRAIASLDPTGRLVAALQAHQNNHPFYMPPTNPNARADILAQLEAGFVRNTISTFAGFRYIQGLILIELQDFHDTDVAQWAHLVAFDDSSIAFESAATPTGLAALNKSVGDVYTEQAHINFNNLETQHYGAVLYAYQAYTRGLADITADSHPVQFLQLYARLWFLNETLPHTFTIDQQEQLAAYSRIWRDTAPLFEGRGREYSFDRVVAQLYWNHAANLGNYAALSQALRYIKQHLANSADRMEDKAEAHFLMSRILSAQSTTPGASYYKKTALQVDAISHSNRARQIYEDLGQLANAHFILRERGGLEFNKAEETGSIEDYLTAIETLRVVAKGWTPEKDGLDWALSNFALNLSLIEVGYDAPDVALFREVLERAELLRPFYPATETPVNAAIILHMLAVPLVYLSRHDDANALPQAVVYAERSAELFADLNEVRLLAYADVTRCTAKADLAEATRDLELARTAQSHCVDARRYFGMAALFDPSYQIGSALRRANEIVAELSK